jgi:ArsR family transcriptional regulator
METLHNHEQQINNLAKQLWALGDRARLQLLILLPEAPDCTQGSNVSTLAQRLNLSQPTVSHHLRVLRQAGFVGCKRICRDAYYWRNTEALAEATAQLSKHFDARSLFPHAKQTADRPSETAFDPAP